METPKKKRANRNSLDSLYRKRDRALERVVEVWLRDEADSEELNKALDVLAVAHATATSSSPVALSRRESCGRSGQVAAAPHYRGKLNKRPEARPAIPSLPIQI